MDYSAEMRYSDFSPPAKHQKGDTRPFVIIPRSISADCVRGHTDWESGISSPEKWQQHHGSRRLSSYSDTSSDFQALDCEEDLVDEGICAPPRQPSPPLSAQIPTASQPLDPVSLKELISNESLRAAEVHPPHNPNQPPVVSNNRQITVSWLMEVVAACGLQQATLFLAVSYLDRFLAECKGVTTGMLQLAAAACVSLAAKQQEFLSELLPTPSEWAAIAGHAFLAPDLVQMEKIVLFHLGWRLRTPSALTFLQLFLCGGGDLVTAGSKREGLCLQREACKQDRGRLTQPVAAAAGYHTELSLLDYGMLRYDYPTIAAASLVAAHRLVEGAEAVETCGLHSLAPFLSRRDVHACAEALGKLHAISKSCCQSGCGGQDLAASDAAVFEPVRAKYAKRQTNGGDGGRGSDWMY